MTKRQENRLSMARAVQDILQQHAGIVSTIPAFAAAELELGQLIAGIGSLVQVQVKKTTGVSQDKQQVEAKAIRAAVKLAGAAKSYALAIQNNTLLDAVSYSATELGRMRDATLVSVLGTIRNKVSPVMAELASYGVSAADLTALEAAITAYDAIVVTPRTNATERVWATDQLDNLFKKLDTILKQMDGIAQLKKETEPEFFIMYSSARKIVDNTGRRPAESGPGIPGNK